MREIKFRAWDGDRYVYPNLIGWYVDVCTCWHDDGFLDTKELEQFTGLHDKNGKEIYEGDIIARPENLQGIGVIQFARGVFGANWDYKENKDPVWRGGRLYGGWGSNHNLRKLDDDVLMQFEVIGNIHENPELING